ncbi:MAG: ABC transporter substrate-binding protein [Bacillota bacterium]|nr:ABC transporter substrate-binding protein [Bacillota bacterium]
MSKQWKGLLGLGIVAALLVAVALVPALTMAAGEIKIGAVAARTGDNAALGEWQANGAKLAVEEINAKGGVLGKKLSLVLEDSQGVPAQAVAVLNKLIYRENVVAVIGDCQSSPVLAMLPVIKTAKIPLLAHGTNPNITKQDNPWVFQTRANDNVKFEALARFLTEKMHYKKIAVLHDAADYGMGGANAVKTYLRTKNLEVVADEQWTPGDKDFSSQLLKIKKAEPEALILIGPMVDMGLAMKQARQMDIKAQFAGGAGIESDTTLGAAGGAGEGLIFAAGFISSNPDPKVQSFVKKFEQKYGYKPNDFAATGYDSIYLLAKAMEKAKSTNPDAVAKALKSLKYEGVEGTFQFNSEGQGLHEMFYGKIVNGAPVFFDPSQK